jgi:hypothetical protein
MVVVETGLKLGQGESDSVKNKGLDYILGQWSAITKLGALVPDSSLPQLT